MSSKVFTILLCTLTCSHASKILFLTCSAARSHQKPFRAVWRELALRGHEVHVLTTSPLNDASLTNLHEYDLSEYYTMMSDKYGRDTEKFMIAKPTFLSAFTKDAFATKVWSDLYNHTLHHREVTRLKNSNERFDVVIAEWIFPTLAAFGAYYRAPLIGITSLGAPSVALDTLGNPQHPLVAPDMNLPITRDMTFKERLLASLYAVWVRAWYHLVVLPREDRNIKASLGQDLPYIGDIEKNVSAILMNRNPVFHRSLPLFPNIVELGGIRDYKVIPAPLDPDLKRFLEKSPNGVVYFSLGSLMRSILLDERIVSTVQRVFAKLPYGVVWKWERDSMPGKPRNVFISKWISQVALLDHPNVKLFITQGGLQSIEEAIAAHKPIIGIPFHSDQTTNVDTCVSYGMGKMLDLEDLTEENLSGYILEIINNSSYAVQAEKLDVLMKDQPQDGLDKAVWWIEYVIRHKGAKHLRSIAADLPWYQYLMLDIYGFLGTVILLVTYSFYLILKVSLGVAKWLLLKKPKGKKKDKKRKSE